MLSAELFNIIILYGVNNLLLYLLFSNSYYYYHSITDTASRLVKYNILDYFCTVACNIVILI